MIGQPMAQLGRVALQAIDAFALLRVQIWFDQTLVMAAMALQHLLRRRFELVGLTLEIRARAAALLGRVARQLHAIDREHDPQGCGECLAKIGGAMPLPLRCLTPDQASVLEALIERREHELQLTV